MKNYLMRVLPTPVKRAMRFIKRSPVVFKEFLFDAYRYVNFSSAVEYRDDKEKLFAIITATYHNIEKGLSLENPRSGFGKLNIDKLIKLLKEYIANYGSSTSLDVPINVLKKYCEFNKSRMVDVGVIEADVHALLALNKTSQSSENVGGGIMLRSKKQIVDVVSKVPQEFFFLRHSVRQFDTNLVSMDAIKIAVSIAQKSPVVCNRQSGKVYAILDKELINKTLEIQGGARGFVESVNVLFCITVDLRNFNGAGERYQGWIDGGMFAMGFIYGLHQQSIASCCLNWSKNHSKDIEMKAHLNIPEYELIIMFVAGGYMKEEFNVAKSERKPMDDVLIVI